MFDACNFQIFAIIKIELKKFTALPNISNTPPKSNVHMIDQETSKIYIQCYKKSSVCMDTLSSTHICMHRNQLHLGGLGYRSCHDFLS